ncbi:MAG: TonB-dependent receptor [Chitinophagaceae bacterium]|nr:TonB-dependent receptor [Chitinophagaceae bacterium]
MRNIYSILILLFILSANVSAQTINTQVIRGQIADDISRAPVSGATVSVEKAPELTTITDNNGNFVLQNVPLGRHTLKVSFVGYEEQVIPEILVTSGKEVILNIALTEKVNTLTGITIKGRGKRSINNEMAVVSSTSFNPGDTRRFAGAVGDPSRMITGFAGVVSASDSRNDIVVRGNSPAGLLWQMEGIDIPNPNHYGSLSSTGGPVSILNSNNLGKSDFFTGAFPAQYGNAVASVFDLRMRNGNANKSEFLGEISFTGFEFGAEGPFPKKSKASYIVNYRYSTVGILNTLGFNIGTGTASPQYQDINFKIFIPLSAKSKFTIWGMGGPSKINFWGNDADTTKNDNLYGNENENMKTKYFTGIAGTTLETNFSDKTYGKLSLGISRTTENILHDSISVESREAFRDWENNYKTTRLSLAYFFSHKFNAKNNVIAGVNSTLYHFNLFDKKIYGNGDYELIRLNQKASTALLQAYAQWKHRFTNKFSLNAGLHFQTLTLNNASAIEPRAGLKYDISNRHSLNLGYGMHSQMQSPVIYFFQSYVDGNIVYSNKELGFTKSQHIVLGYNYKINPTLIFKTELYYQDVSHVPVERFASGFSLLNEGADFGIVRKDSLVNRGSGKNYGVEFTIEKYFSNDYYFLITTSLFNSKYKGSDGIERNTAFNTKYAYNILAGKDFSIANIPGTFSINARVSGVGGKYTSPVNIRASIANGNTEYDEVIAPYSIRQSPYFRADLKFGYRRNYRKSTLEAGIDLRNFTNHKNIFIQSYNRRTNSIVNQNQQGFLPVPYFRFTF